MQDLQLLNEPSDYVGIGKTARRRMIKRWKEDGAGLSLKQWAQRQHPVGDAAFVWLKAKQRCR